MAPIFENATAAFRQAGLTAATAPVIVGAGVQGYVFAVQRLATLLADPAR